MKLSKKQCFFGLISGLAGVLIAIAPLPVRAAAPTHRTFRVEASQFAYLPAVLRVNPGDTVTIELVSQDVVHGLFVDGYGVSITADPGQTARLTFTADRPGSFRFRCNVTCGALHPFMIGKIQVGSNITLWRAIALTVLAVITGIFLFPRPAKAQAA
jgi:heme/copper-type cytochrome/quinol oxidase subunit 2